MSPGEWLHIYFVWPADPRVLTATVSLWYGYIATRCSLCPPGYVCIATWCSLCPFELWLHSSVGGGILYIRVEWFLRRNNGHSASCDKLLWDPISKIYFWSAWRRVLEVLIKTLKWAIKKNVLELWFFLNKNEETPNIIYFLLDQVENQFLHFGAYKKN